MATSDIITGQFVRISQTPASVGDRIIARIIDYIAIILYTISVSFLFTSYFYTTNSMIIVFFMLPAIFYSFICETFNHGQTLGKYIMKTRVVKADGSTPGVGDFLLRWIFLLIDVHISCIGLLAIICTKKNQRFGDMTAGTMVIKLSEYKKLHVSLDEFDYARRDYTPVYPEAAKLSLGQVDVISKTLYGSETFNAQQAERLSAKIQEMLGIKPKEKNDADFLLTLLHDYQYYALELV